MKVAKNSDRALAIELLAEHEVTRLIRLVAAIAERLEIAAAEVPELSELARDVAPAKVMERMREEEESGIRQ